MKTLIVIALIMIAVYVVYLVSKDWKRTLQVVGGWGVYEIICLIYDYPIWLFLVGYFGDVNGSIIASVGAFAQNLALIIWYQKNGTDWLGVNILEEIKERAGVWVTKINNHRAWYVRFGAYVPVRFFRAIICLLRKSDFTAFIVLSLWKDSFVTTAFLRHGKFGQLEKRDYMIFITSTILSCLWWSVFSVTILKVLQFIWTVLVG
jgi:hypothetical protein